MCTNFTMHPNPLPCLANLGEWIWTKSLTIKTSLSTLSRRRWRTRYRLHQLCVDRHLPNALSFSLSLTHRHTQTHTHTHTHTYTHTHTNAHTHTQLHIRSPLYGRYFSHISPSILEDAASERWGWVSQAVEDSILLRLHQLCVEKVSCRTPSLSLFLSLSFCVSLSFSISHTHTDI